MHGMAVVGSLLILLSGSLLAAQSESGAVIRTQPVDYRTLTADFADRIEAGLRKQKVVGLSIALVDDQRIVWRQGFGYADRSRRIPVTAETRFQAGDMTKLFTAIAVMQLVESGAFALDDRLDALLPELEWISTDYPVPTVQQLLTHHGGLPTSELAGSYREQPLADLPVPGPLFQSQPTGEIFTYSHLGFVVLGRLVERYTGKPFVQAIQQRVLSPLAMTGAGFEAGDEAIGHTRRRQPEPNLYPRDLPALGLIARPTDLAQMIRWMLRADTRPVLSRSTVEEMVRVHNHDVPLDLENDVGLGWYLTNTGNHRVDQVLRLNTSTIHFRGILLIAPKEKLGVVVMANSSTAIELVLEIARGALDAMLERKFGIQPPPRETEIPERIPLAGEARNDTMHSRYSTALGLAEFDGDADSYDMDFLGRGFGARLREDGWYEVVYRLFGLFDVQFNLLDSVLIRPARINGHRVLLGWYQGSQFLFGSALTQGQSWPELERLEGRYRLINRDALSGSLEMKDIELVFDRGVLYASYRLPIFIPLRPRLPLTPMGAGRYRIPGLGTNLGEMVEIDESSGEIRYSGYRFIRAD